MTTKKLREENLHASHAYRSHVEPERAPRSFLAGVAAFALLVGTLVAPAACIRPNPQTVASILSAAEIACILFHDDVEDSKVLSELCGITIDHADDIVRIVSARKSAKAQAEKAGKPLSWSKSAPSTSASASPAASH